MRRLMVCCETDLPSVNMRDRLIEISEWSDDGVGDDCTFLSRGDDLILSTGRKHIYLDNVEDLAQSHGFDPDVVVFMSRHSAASGEPAITVHPIGNYHEAQYGGKDATLVKASPMLMSDCLRLMKEKCHMPEFQVCFEVTHHGPYSEKPTFFMEIGSDERNWGNKDAADVLAHVLDETYGMTNDYPSVIGIAGGHYAPRFTELVLGSKVNMGHMIPNYQLADRDDEDIIRMIRDATKASDTKMVYLHRNSLKKPEQRRILDLIGTEFEAVRTADFDPIH